MNDALRVRLNKEKYQRALRRKRDLTNTRLADRLNIRLDSLSHYVAGRRLMPYAQVVRLADWLGVDVEDLCDMSTVTCSACGCNCGRAAA